MPHYQIEIVKCYGGRDTVDLKTQADDLDQAVAAAIACGWPVKGRLYFWRDNGISVGPDALTGTQYGQIMQRLPDGSGTSRSGRVAIRAKLL